MFESGKYYRMGQKVFYLSLLRAGLIFLCGLIAVLIVSGIVGFNSKMGQGVLTSGIILFLLYAIAAILIAKYQYACREFMLDEYALHIRTGIINRSEISIPFRQIQDVNIEESYMERSFGVTSLSLLTAGHEDVKYSVPGEAGVPREESSALFPLIERKYADELEKVLMHNANIQQVVSARPEASV